MKIVFVDSISVHKSVIVFQNGLLTLASILKGHGHDVEIIDFNFLVRTGKIPKGNPSEMIRCMCDYLTGKNASVIGFHTICAFYPNSILLAWLVKQKNPSVKVVFGGPQASSCPVETLTAFDWIDLIAIGESEQNILKLTDALSEKIGFENIPGIAYRKNGSIIMNPQTELIENLDDLPFLDYSLIPHLESMSTITLDVGRGCPFSCRFCSTKTFWKKKFRIKSVGRIISEMDKLCNEYGFTHFSFLHDHFTVNKKSIRDFCNALIDSGKSYTWNCSSRADTLDEELVLLMKKAGCTRMIIGMETGSPRMQQLTGKNLDLLSAWEIIKVIVRNNLKIKLSFIYGFPEEKEKDLQQTLDLIRRSVALGVDDVSLYQLVMLNGTEYYEIYKNHLVPDKIGMPFGDDFNLEETSELILNHPEIFPNFFRFPSHLLIKYKYLDIFVSFYSFLQKYFPLTFKILLEFFRLNLKTFYLDIIKSNQDFGASFSIALKKIENLDWEQVLLLHISYLENYIRKNDWQNNPDDLVETFGTEKTILCLKAGIPLIS